MVHPDVVPDTSLLSTLSSHTEFQLLKAAVASLPFTNNHTEYQVEVSTQHHPTVSS